MDHLDRPPFAPRGRRRPRSGLLAASLLLLVAMTLATAPGAEALRQWCRTDPVVLIGGDVADIFVSAPLNAPLRVTGPNRIVVMVPEGVETALVLATLGFGQGEQVEFVESRKLRTTARGIQLKIKVYVPATVDMPVRVEFAPRLIGILDPVIERGTANHWVVLDTVF
jgi:hypothetical protein